MIPKMTRSHRARKLKTTAGSPEAPNAREPEEPSEHAESAHAGEAGDGGDSGDGGTNKQDGPPQLRTAYREHLEAFNADLLEMCDRVRAAMAQASEALLRQSLEGAEDTLSQVDALRELKTRCEERGMSLLALESPVASDLRQVLSSIYIVENLSRMSSLAMHVATLTRARHPDAVVPGPLAGFMEEMARLSDAMVAQTRELLLHPDAECAAQLHTIDEDMDDMKAYLLNLVTAPEWEYSNREAVDVAMVVRYYERFADRCVNVGNRIVFLVTGLQPEQYREQRDGDYDLKEKFATIERRFTRK